MRTIGEESQAGVHNDTSILVQNGEGGTTQSDEEIPFLRREVRFDSSRNGEDWCIKSRCIIENKPKINVEKGVVVYKCKETSFPKITITKTYL